MKKCPFCAEEIQDEAIVCRHCGRDLKGGASQVQLVTPKKKTGCVALGCAGVLGLLLVGWLASLFTPSPVPRTQPTTIAVAPTTAASLKPTPPPTKWTVSRSTSKADDSKTVQLQLEAETSVKGWLATETPTLCIRCKEHKTEVYIVTGMPPNVEYGHSDEATITLRFDKEPAGQYLASESTDKKALFVPTAIGLAKTMVQHKRMLFRFVPFNSSPQETEFDLAGLDKALPEVEAACGWKEAAAARSTAESAQRAEQDRQDRQTVAKALPDLKWGASSSTMYQAAQALLAVKLTPDEAQDVLPTLIKNLSSNSTVVRGPAAELLGNIGAPLALEALPLLDSMAKDDNSLNVRNQASTAARKIRGTQ